MATTQYIGARYVPIFVGEWDNTRTYEPLMVVTYQGASYTSRQYVPAGIEITNESYWVLSANYNAQVEAYRKEVRDILPYDETPTEDSTKGVTSDGIKKAIDTAEQTNADAIANEVTRAKGAEQALTEKITKIESSEKSYLSLAYYIDNFDGGNLNTALSKALAEHPNTEAIYVPSGNYVVDTPIDLRQTSVLYFSGDNATIKATSSMEFIIATKTYNTLVDGLIIDGNWLAQQGIYLNTQATLRNCLIKNCTTDYIAGYSQGLHIYNVRIMNEAPVEHRGTQGIACGTDCIIQNTWIWGQKTGINCRGNCVISTAYFWNAYGVEEMTGIYSTSDINISNIFFDCINTPVYANTITGNNIIVFVNGNDTKNNTNPYYKFTKVYIDQSQIFGFHCSVADDFKRKFKTPDGIPTAFNIVSSSAKTMSNYNENEFNQFNLNNSNSIKNTCNPVDNFETNAWYKVAEIHHTQWYSCVIAMTSPASRGGFLTITDASITYSQSFFYLPFFNTEDSIKFNDENGVLSIYTKLTNSAHVCVYGVLADSGITGLFVLPNFEKSTLSSYNRSFTA